MSEQMGGGPDWISWAVNAVSAVVGAVVGWWATLKKEKRDDLTAEATAHLDMARFVDERMRGLVERLEAQSRACEERLEAALHRIDELERRLGVS